MTTNIMDVLLKTDQDKELYFLPADLTTFKNSAKKKKKNLIFITNELNTFCHFIIELVEC